MKKKFTINPIMSSDDDVTQIGVMIKFEDGLTLESRHKDIFVCNRAYEVPQNFADFVEFVTKFSREIPTEVWDAVAQWQPNLKNVIFSAAPTQIQGDEQLVADLQHRWDYENPPMEYLGQFEVTEFSPAGVYIRGGGSTLLTGEEWENIRWRNSHS